MDRPLLTPSDILQAYSRGEIASSQAIDMLHLDGYRALLAAVCDADLPLPRPSPEETEAMVAVALPILRAALKKAEVQN